MGSEKHLLVNDDIFELVNIKCAELVIKGVKVNLCDITNLAIEKGIDNAMAVLNGNNKEW